MPKQAITACLIPSSQTFALPRPGMLDDGGEFGILWLPAQFQACAARVRYEPGRVAGAAWTDHERDLPSRNGAGGVDDLLYRKPRAVAEIVGGASRSLP